MATSTDPGSPQPDLTPSLIVKLRSGDAGAAEMLESLYREPIRRFCWRMLGQWEDAEDATQETFYEVLRVEAVPDRFRAWIYKIALNECLNRRRGRDRRRERAALPRASALGGERTGALSRLARDERGSRLVHVLGTLRAEERVVVCLRKVEGLSVADTAYVLGIDEALVKSRCYEGIRKLRDHTSLI